MTGNNDKREQLARIADILDRFKLSEVGEYLWDRADALEREAELEFRNVDPHDADAVQALQNEMVVADLFRQFVYDGIVEGDMARFKAPEVDY